MPNLSFFLSGFLGFVFFYSVSLMLARDLVLSLVYGTGGSLFFSFSGRLILDSMLKAKLSSGISRQPSENEDKKRLSPSNPPKNDFENIENSMGTSMETASNSAGNLKKIFKIIHAIYLHSRIARCKLFAKVCSSVGKLSSGDV